MYGPRGAQFVQARLQGRTLTSWEMAPKVGDTMKNGAMTLFTEDGNSCSVVRKAKAKAKAKAIEYGL